MSRHPTIVAAIAHGTFEERMAAWAAAYVEHRRKMLGAAFKKVGNQDDAFDAVQTAMSEVMTRDPSKLAKVTNLGAYLARAASNRAIDIVRKRESERTDATAPEDLIDLAGDEHDVAEQVIDRFALENGFTILDEMPEKQRIAFEQRVLEARPAKDVAQEVGVKPQYVPTLVRKATAFIEERSAFIETGTIDLTSPTEPSGETKDAS